MKAQAMILLLLLGLTMAPVAEAQSKVAPGVASNEFCREFQVAKVVGVSEAGTITFCVAKALSVLEGNEFTGTGTITAPVLQAGSTLDVSFNPSSSAACAVVSESEFENDVQTVGVIRTEIFVVDMGKGTACHGYWMAEIQDAAQQTVWLQSIAFNIPRDLSTGGFAAITGTTALELVAFFAVICLGLLLWARFTDSALQYVGAVFVMIPGLFWVLIFNAAGVSINLTLGLIALVMGAYLLVRTSYELIAES